MGELIGLVAVSAPFLMVLGIVWIGSQKKLEEKRIAATAEMSSEKAAQYASHTAELEQRVRVLERIVTDRGYDIATQIEALRDQKQVEDTDNGVPLGIDRKETA
uniref:hypothetical protein n=1 Tax=Parerythrobacter lutipelagi TaxID=1964208 RepID=UPI001F020087|nr:hypothetical protein [Parerythrobacter lutipelagi]